MTTNLKRAATAEISATRGKRATQHEESCSAIVRFSEDTRENQDRTLIVASGNGANVWNETLGASRQNATRGRDSDEEVANHLPPAEVPRQDSTENRDNGHNENDPDDDGYGSDSGDELEDAPMDETSALNPRQKDEEMAKKAKEKARKKAKSLKVSFIS